MLQISTLESTISLQIIQSSFRSALLYAIGHWCKLKNVASLWAMNVQLVQMKWECGAFSNVSLGIASDVVLVNIFPDKYKILAEIILKQFEIGMAIVSQVVDSFSLCNNRTANENKNVLLRIPTKRTSTIQYYGSQIPSFRFLLHPNSFRYSVLGSVQGEEERTHQDK